MLGMEHTAKGEKREYMVTIKRNCRALTGVKFGVEESTETTQAHSNSCRIIVGWVQAPNRQYSLSRHSGDQERMRQVGEFPSLKSVL